MSQQYSMNVSAEELVDFLLHEHEIDTGVPVHPFSAINSAFSAYDKTLGITDGRGTLFLDECYATAYGSGNDYTHMTRALKRCGVAFHFNW